MGENCGMVHGVSEISKKNMEDEFLRLCKYICLNYEMLKNEFAEINNVLRRTRVYAIAYSQIDFVKLHLNEYNSVLKLELLNEVSLRLEKIKQGSKEEFLQNINFLNLMEEIFSKKSVGDIISFIWKAQNSLDYIVYEIERINNAEDVNKKIAILKGMIAYY